MESLGHLVAEHPAILPRQFSARTPTPARAHRVRIGARDDGSEGCTTHPDGKIGPMDAKPNQPSVSGHAPSSLAAECWKKLEALGVRRSHSLFAGVFTIPGNMPPP